MKNTLFITLLYFSFALTSCKTNFIATEFVSVSKSAPENFARTDSLPFLREDFLALRLRRSQSLNLPQGNGHYSDKYSDSPFYVYKQDVITDRQLNLFEAPEEEETGKLVTEETYLYLHCIAETLRKVESFDPNEKYKEHTAIYWITRPFRWDVLRNRYFNTHDELSLAPIRRILVGKWRLNLRTREVEILFNHKKRLIGFKGHYDRHGQFIMTEANHPSWHTPTDINKDFDYMKKRLDYIRIADIFDLGKMDGLVFGPTNKGRRIYLNKRKESAGISHIYMYEKRKKKRRRPEFWKKKLVIKNKLWFEDEKEQLFEYEGDLKVLQAKK